MQPPPPDKKFRIFAVDDAPEIRALLKGALQNEQWLITVFESAEKAIEACEEEMPDLIISDLEMGEMNGNQLCQWVKNKTIDDFIPVIILTAHGDSKNKITGLDSGADDYVTKPFDFEELKARARALLRTRSLALALKDAKNVIEDKEKQIIATQIAAGTAHELGQPLTTIALNYKLLRETAPGSLEQKEILGSIESGCQQMKEILGRLNNLERYSSSSYTAGLAIANILKTE